MSSRYAAVSLISRAARVYGAGSVTDFSALEAGGRAAAPGASGRIHASPYESGVRPWWGDGVGGPGARSRRPRVGSESAARRPSSKQSKLDFLIYVGFFFYGSARFGRGERKGE